jgi:hypothetical protein
MMTPDIAQAQRFLNRLDPNGEFTFQTFSDRKLGAHGGPLSRVLHGSLPQHVTALAALNARGAGVFVMVNRGDGVVRPGRKTCRGKENVVAVRALFVDLDGAPPARLLDATPPPSIVVETSSGRYHGYWTDVSCPLEDFESAQISLARHFEGDESVSDLPRVMRLPGYLHRKAEPFMSRIVLC